MNLRDRVAVVTGASSGIGRAVAGALGSEGCRLAICARTGTTLESAAESLARDGAEVLAVATDVARAEEVERLAETVESEMGGAEVLVNNAGIGRFGRVDELTPEEFDRTFAVNVRGLYLCSRAFVPGMIARGGGVIVNIVSLAAKNPFPDGSAYVGSKAAALAISRCMTLELREHGIRVLAVCPGSVDTPFFDKQEKFEPDRDRILRPEDVADLVVSAVRLSDRGTVSEVELRPVDP